MILIILLSFTEFDDLPLTVGKTDMATIVKVMQVPDSGLEIRDRMWLKITISNAVIGKMSFAFITCENISLMLLLLMMF